MSFELAKTISTGVIWLSLAVSLTFGLFKMNINGDLPAVLLGFCLPVVMTGGAVAATGIVWRSRSERQAEALPPMISPDTGR